MKKAMFMIFRHMCVIVVAIVICAPAERCIASKQPNVLFIVVDDLRTEMGCYGKDKLLTPNIDRFAEQAMLFDKAYCQVALCVPSRHSFLTGLRPKANWSNRNMPRNVVSLPRHFKNNGYDSISIGKTYHHNAVDQEGWTTRFTDTFNESPYVCNGWAAGYQQEKNIITLRTQPGIPMKTPLTEMADRPDDSYPDGRVAWRAVNQLREYGKNKKPFFMTMGFYRPHLPWVAPKEYWDLYQRDEVDLAANPDFPKHGIGRNSWGDLMHYHDAEVRSKKKLSNDLPAEEFPVLSEAKQRELIHGYWACVSFVDAQIGRVLAELKQSNLDRNTIVIFTSDHGWHLGDHRLWSKQTNYEICAQVPLLIAAPEMKPGTTGQLAELVDLYPTLCDLTGLAQPGHLQGTSLREGLESPDSKGQSVAFSAYAGGRSMRTSRYRLTVYDAKTKNRLPGNGLYELYDYQDDPLETRNLAVTPEHQQLLKELRQKMDIEWSKAHQEQ